MIRCRRKGGIRARVVFKSRMWVVYWCKREEKLKIKVCLMAMTRGCFGMCEWRGERVNGASCLGVIKFAHGMSNQYRKGVGRLGMRVLITSMWMMHVHRHGFKGILQVNGLYCMYVGI